MRCAPEPHQRQYGCPTRPFCYPERAGRILVGLWRVRPPGTDGKHRGMVRVTTSERDARKPHTRGDPISRRPREWSHSPPARLVTSRRSLFKNIGGDSRHRASLSRPSLDGKYFEDFERARARATQPCAHDVPVIRSSRRCTDDARTRPPLAPARAQSGDGVRVSDHFGCE